MAMMTNDKFLPAARSRKIVLPSFVLTEICDAGDEGAVKVSLRNDAETFVFYERPKLTPNGHRTDGKPKWKRTQFNFYPVVLDALGLPWPEANVYILSRLEDALNPSMSTYDGLADDLTAYRRFLDEESIDWRVFPAQKLSRPTYRYSSHLRRLINTGQTAASSAKRRMGSVIAFYNWMIKEGELNLAHAPWKESDVFFKFTGEHGSKFTKHITTTDVSIRVPKQQDPYEGKINDGGKLRPLATIEQAWIVEALCAQGNTEMLLIHLLSLVTGARIQTVLTFRLKHAYTLTFEQLQGAPLAEIRCPIGPGTGIDTKRDKQMLLYIPLWVYRMLRTYADSPRARHRRLLAKGGDTETQYLFLSKYGLPFYSSKEDSRNFNPASTQRQPIKGQSIRKFMSEVVIPYIRRKYDISFHYQFHDLRASFGMNLTESQLKLVEQQKRTLSQVREFVKVRMGHESAVTTDRYLQFRGNLVHIQKITDDHGNFLKDLVDKAGLS